MRYVGGKSRIARWIRESIKPLVNGHTRYLEPFVGSGACFTELAPLFRTTVAADSHLDLILMWQAIAAGWDPPEHISREVYMELRNSEPSPLRGFVGFGASFSGKWFGGYVDTAWDAHWQRFTKPYLAAAKKSVLAAAPTFRTAASIQHTDYRTHYVDPTTIVYCDPPYAGTLGYGGTEPFDSAAFWMQAEHWSRSGALVVVSESQAPKGWQPLAVRERKAMLRVAKGTENEVRREALFVFNSVPPVSPGRNSTPGKE